MTNVMSSCSGCSNESFSAVIERGDEVISAAEAITRGGGSVLKAPQRRRGGTPPRSETAKLHKHPYPRIRYKNPRIRSQAGEDTGIL